MKKVESDKQQMEEPTHGYDLRQAVIETNDAIKEVAQLVSKVAQSVSTLALSVGKEGEDGGNA